MASDRPGYITQRCKVCRLFLREIHGYDQGEYSPYCEEHEPEPEPEQGPGRAPYFWHGGPEFPHPLTGRDSMEGY